MIVGSTSIARGKILVALVTWNCLACKLPSSVVVFYDATLRRNFTALQHIYK